MILIGSTQLTFTKGQGSFHCPTCSTDTNYRVRIAREFLTVYFIPLIPLGMRGQYVECSRCKGQFDVRVLSLDPKQLQAQRQREAHTHIMRVLVLLMIADGSVDDAELEALQQFLQRVTGEQVTRQQLAGEIAVAQRARIDALSYTSAIRSKLDRQQCELLAEGAFLVNSASGEIGERQTKLLAQLPAALEISEDDFRRIIVRAAEQQ